MGDTAATSQAAGLESLPRTKEGWIPITHFDCRYFAEGQDFLVQLSGAAHAPHLTHRGSFVCAAQWMIDDEGGPAKFVGDWRYVDGLRHLEPVAFQAMPAPVSWPELYPLLVTCEKPWPSVNLDIASGPEMRA